MIPSTAEESVVEISTLDQLKTFRDNVNKDVSNDISVKLTANINLEGSASKQWTPIGDCVTNQYGSITTDHSFKGKFDGQGYTISGLYISTDKDYQGLFGCVSGDAPEVKNLTVSGSVVADESVGIVVGGLRKGTVKNCTSDGSVKGRREVGGIVGNSHGSVESCAASCRVVGTYVNTGGIVGGSWQAAAAVKNCAATGDVSGVNYVGGVVGQNNGGKVENCVAAGNVSGTKDVLDVYYIGGVVGGNNNNTPLIGRVKNCAATGDVSGTNTSSNNYYVGGVIGENLGTVENCAATGSVSVTGTGAIGGIVGADINGTLTNCGWLTATAEKGIGSESGSTSSDVISFAAASKDNIAVACLPDPMSITVANGASKTVTLKAWPANKAITAANHDSITAAVSPDATLASATVDGAVATVTGKKNGTGVVNFTFNLKPTHFTGSCDGVSTDVELAPSAGLTVKDTTGFTVSPTALSLGINATGTITATETASWTVANGAIASISAATGASVTVTGLAAGTTTITATNELGETAKCEVTVSTGGGSSGGGCSAGFGALALLALMPLAWRRKK